MPSRPLYQVRHLQLESTLQHRAPSHRGVRTLYDNLNLAYLLAEDWNRRYPGELELRVVCPAINFDALARNRMPNPNPNPADHPNP